MLCRAVDMAAMGAHSRALLRRPFQLLQDKHSSVHRQARRSPLQYSHLKGSHPCPALGGEACYPQMTSACTCSHTPSCLAYNAAACRCLLPKAPQGCICSQDCVLHLPRGYCTA